MLVTFLKRYRNMILTSIFFFYFGCGITLNLLKFDCSNADNKFERKVDSNVLDKIEYAVLILSSSGNKIKRGAIRTTWMNFARNMMKNRKKLHKWQPTNDRNEQDIIKLFFVIGNQNLNKETLMNLKIENEQNNDILVLDDVIDNYNNLTRKMLSAIKWFSINLNGMKYLIKCDDDSFVRVDLIVKELENYAPAMNSPKISEYVSYKDNLSSYKGLYWGYFDGRAKPFSNGKWNEQKWFLSDNYLPYALGGGYVISRSIVDFIAQNSHILSCYNSEDVSMGVWTAALDGINRVHDIRFDTEWKSRGCHNQMLVRHKQTPNDMFEMYEMLSQSFGEILCKTEIKQRRSYVYKWNVIPSACCRWNNK